MLRPLVLLIVIGILGFVTWRVWKWTRADAVLTAIPRGTPAADPRLTYATPYRNVRPEVKYVGDAKCAACHRDVCDAYHQHPMAQSLAALETAPPLERFDRRAHNPFEKFGFEFSVERDGKKIFHKTIKRDAQGKEGVALAREVQYVLGSGTHGRAYLSSIDNYLFQTPINWFSHAGRWDLAPNIGSDHGRNFFAGAEHACIFCHANHAEPVSGSRNRLSAPLPANPAIGCERCHGPGELHVDRRRRGDDVTGIDDTIVNPRRLEPALREAVCQQCHLQGTMRVVRRGREVFDYRPGLPLHLFWSVFLQPADPTREHKAVSHVEQMLSSRCFRESKGKLGCTSCHDPHVFPKASERVSVYRQRCLNCHDDSACPVPSGERLSKNNNSCFECHMPHVKNTDVAHSAASDHRVLRAPGKAVQAPGDRSRRVLPQLPYVYFFDDAVDTGDPDVRRDFALALLERIEQLPPGQAQQLAHTALMLVDGALENDADDVPALHARGYLLSLQGLQSEALAAFEEALQKAPDRELTLTFAAQVAQGRKDIARSYWRRAIAVNPYDYGYHEQLARLYFATDDWPEALAECRKALELNPFSVEARGRLIFYYLERGDKPAAGKEFDKLMLLDLPQAELMRKKFEQGGR